MFWSANIFVPRTHARFEPDLSTSLISLLYCTKSKHNFRQDLHLVFFALTRGKARWMTDNLWLPLLSHGLRFKRVSPTCWPHRPAYSEILKWHHSANNNFSGWCLKTSFLDGFLSPQRLAKMIFSESMIVTSTVTHQKHFKFQTEKHRFPSFPSVACLVLPVRHCPLDSNNLYCNYCFHVLKVPFAFPLGVIHCLEPQVAPTISAFESLYATPLASTLLIVHVIMTAAGFSKSRRTSARRDNLYRG